MKLLAATLLILPVPATAADIAKLAKAYGARQDVQSMSLSPSGDRILYRTPVGTAGTAVRVVEIATGKASIILSSDQATVTPYGCGWKTENRVLCRVEFIYNIAGQRASFNRTMSMAADGSGKPLELGSRTTDRTVGVDQQGARVIDWLPDDPQHVLMQVFVPETQTEGTNIRGDEPGITVQKVNVDTGRMTPVERANPLVRGYDSDDRGQVRFMFQGARDSTGYERDRISYFVRAKNSRNWRKLSSETLSGPTITGFSGFDDSGDNIFVTRAKDGRAALFREPADGSGTSELVFAHPVVDVEGVFRIGKYRRPVAAAFTVDAQEYAYFDAALEKRTKALSAALPGKPPVVVLDESWDGKRNLLFAGGLTDPGQYYRFDTMTRQLEPLLAVRAAAAELPAAAQSTVRYKAADGTMVPAYLTLPPGIASMRGLPAIVMPHGGPASRDTLGFDWLVQFWAQAGYAVLQPNFRGSTGYGADWYQENGFKSWATAIGDVNAAGRWMIAEGADAARLAIFGWSYGGYAALQGAAVDPGLYKAVVAVAPVTDLSLLKRNSSGYSNYQVVANYIGEGPHIEAGSPAQNAAKIIAPVLILHGDKDLNVDISQAKLMDSALTKAGKRHELIVYPGLEHSLDDSAARIDMLTRSANWLAGMGK